MVFIILKRPWICSPKVMPQLMIAVQQLLWLCRTTTGMTVLIATNACENNLLWCHCAISFLQACFTLVASLHFFSPYSSPWCKSCLQLHRFWQTSSHFSMFIALMSFLQMSLKLRWCHPLTGDQFPTMKNHQNPPINRLLIPLFCWY